MTGATRGATDAELAARIDIDGTGRSERDLGAPHRGQLLRGDALSRRIAAWLEAVSRNPEWLRLDGRRVALLGAARRRARSRLGSLACQ